MQTLTQQIVDNNSYFLIGIMIFNVILFITMLVHIFKVRKLQAQYKQFMMKDDVDLETLLIAYSNRVTQLEADKEAHDKKIYTIEDKLKTAIQKTSIMRYKAIDNVGSDLSFVIAFLDETNNGVILNGIYTRNGSYTYAKPVIAGESTYQLSDEEMQVLKEAISKR
ncbi:MAG: hypothetical protein ATN36_00975 [Epulopiscium sp. Nele67-Bin005]|nr:MAG: hypothetical protein ATN36_00975 [Epulopiscium sp. Nele67-Bin005]